MTQANQGIREAAVLLPRIWAAFGLLLIAVTWPLWLPGLAANAYPPIPLFSDVIDVPPVLLDGLTMAIVACLLAVVLAPRRCRWCWAIASAAWCVSFLADQHRLQPWAYQLAIFGLIFASMDARRGYRWLVPLVASVYIFSALGKLDYQFAHSVGQDFLSTVMRPIGGVPAGWDEATRAKLALLFPSVELIAGCGLILARTRPIAGVVIVGMHVALIGILGPWGLDHSTGVLAWNAALLVQAWGLMVWPGWRTPEAPDQNGSAWGWPLAASVVMLALVMPLSERAGHWDHWLSWSLYSPHTSRVEVQVHRSAVQQLPPAVSTHVRRDDDGDGWQSVSLDQWSLHARRVPIYPQARYQLGLTLELARQSGIEDEIRVRVRGVSDRWTGTRQEQPLIGGDEIERYGRASWWAW